MLSYIKGTVVAIQEDLLVLENHDIGYNIRITGQTATQLPGIGKQIQIFTYLYVKEDAMLLYGFLSMDDLNIFKLLLTVNGIGPKGGLSVLNAISPNELRLAIIAADAKAIAKAPGIGTKTAQRIILDLKDKCKIEDMFDSNLNTDVAVSSNTGVKEEAIEALLALGYSNIDAIKAVNPIIITEDMNTEAVLKKALRNLSLI